MPGQQAMYMRVASRIREEVTAGAYRLGDLLPGEIELAARYGVARATLTRALGILRDEGVITTEMGIGSRVASVPLVATVLIGPGDWAAARMPEDEERQRLRMSPGVPVLVITRPGAEPEVYDASVTRLSGAG